MGDVGSRCRPRAGCSHLARNGAGDRVEVDRAVLAVSAGVLVEPRDHEQQVRAVGQAEIDRADDDGRPGGGPRTSRGIRSGYTGTPSATPSPGAARGGLAQPVAACRRGCARGDRGGRRAPGGRPPRRPGGPGPRRTGSPRSGRRALRASRRRRRGRPRRARPGSRPARPTTRSPRSGASSVALGPPVTAAAVAAAWARTSGWGSSSSAVAHRAASAVAVPRRVSRSAAARTWCDGSQVRSETYRRDRWGRRASERTTEKRTTTLGCRSSGTSRTPGRGARSSSARRDSDRRVAVVRERLDEPVDGPLVPVPEGGEGGDAGHADVQLGAAKPAEEQDARLVVVGWRGLERGALRRGDGGGRVGRQLVATSAKPPDRDRGEEDEPAARDQRGDRPEAPPSIHA